MSEFTRAVEHSAELKQGLSKRDSMCKAMEDLYFMEWDEEAKVSRQIKNVKITKSPRARNALQGAIRLLIATDPMFSVPYDINGTFAKAQASKIERFVKAMWNVSGRVRGDPVHYDVVRSALLYAEVHLTLTSTKDLVDWSKGASKARQRRAEDLAERTPYLFDCINPQRGYPYHTRLGLEAFATYSSVKVAEVKSVWGKLANPALGKLGTKVEDGEVVKLWEYWDLDNHFTWLDGIDVPILEAEHGLPYIPIVAQTVEGSKLFDDDPSKQREPFLYTMYKSDLWKRQNMILTVLYSMLFAIGANPMFKFVSQDPEADPNVDFSQPGGVVKLRQGEQFEPLQKQVIDPSMQQGWIMATELEGESTISRQALGDPLGASTPYSMIALLSQSGRLPLAVPQRKTSWGISELVEIALKCLKEDKREARAINDADNVLLGPDEIPKHLTVNAQLEISLPQDRLQAANTASIMAGGDDPMVSKTWVRENILSIGQSDEMTKEIWEEQVANLHARKYIMDQMAQIAQAEQMAMQPGQASGMPGMSQMGAPAMPQQSMPGMNSGMPQGPQPMGEQPPMPGEQEPIPPMPPIQPKPQRLV